LITELPMSVKFLGGFDAILLSVVFPVKFISARLGKSKGLHCPFFVTSVDKKHNEHGETLLSSK